MTESMETDTIMQLDDQFDPKLSLYLPSIEEKVTQLGLTQIFQTNKIGIIERVDFVYNTKGVRQAFIHLSEWFENENNKEFQKKIINNKETAIIKCKKISGHKTNNLIVLPNRNPRQLGHTDLLSALQNRINLLEEQVRILSIDNLSVPTKRNRS